MQACKDVLADLKEDVDKIDLAAGVIETQKTLFGEPKDSGKDAASSPTFWQRKVITLKKTATEEQTEVTLRVVFTRQTPEKPEETVADEAAANVVRGVFFAKLEKFLK